MSLINRLISEAKAGAAQVNIRPRDVRKVAVHAHACDLRSTSVEEIEASIRDGKLKLVGVSIRVMGLTSSRKCST